MTHKGIEVLRLRLNRSLSLRGDGHRRSTAEEEEEDFIY